MYELGGNYAEFLTDIGIDDEAPPGSSATFQVWIDGQPEFDSGIMQAQSPVRHLRIGVAGAKILKLVVTDGGNGNLGDNTDWAGARLIAK